jgi:O-antigen chain-terminating methyltransferase
MPNLTYMMMENNMASEFSSINELVNALPEIYQPIFNHPELSASSSRKSIDILKKIENSYEQIEKLIGRPLKVLDLGCAQGFFSLSLAQLGAIVTGIDYSKPNIDVCNYLALENNHLNVTFRLDSVDSTITALDKNDYDFVIGMSIFHHLIHEHGLAYVESLISDLSKKINVGIYEFALDTEPLYWASSQPSEPRNLLNEYKFTHEISRHGTHLSKIDRPLFFASNDFWLLGVHAGSIESTHEKSHDLDQEYHKKTRRFFYSDKKLIKVFRINDSECGANEKEIAREVTFLKSPPKCFAAPEILDYGKSDSDSWLVRQLIEGELFTRFLNIGGVYDPELILKSILYQLACLELNGLYHGDVRPWNLLILPDGSATLIDYGAISQSTEDGQDVYGQILSFFVLAREIITGKIRDIASERPAFVSPNDFKGKYKKWTNAVWAMPTHKWSFQSVLENFNNAIIGENAENGKEQNILTSLPGVIESHLSVLARQLNWDLQTVKQELLRPTREEARITEVQNQLLQAQQVAQKALDQMQQLHAQLQKAQQFAQTAQEQMQQLQVQLQKAQQVAQTAQEKMQQALAKAEQDETLAMQRMARINALLSSVSWRITAPLRWLAKPITGYATPSLFSISQTQGESIFNTPKAATEKFHILLHELDKNNSIKRLPNIAMKIWLSLENSPKIREILLRILRISPALDHKIRKMYEQSILNKQQPLSDWLPVEKRDHTISAASTKIREINLLVANSNTPISPLNSLETTSNGINSGQRSPLEAHNLDHKVNR